MWGIVEPDAEAEDPLSHPGDNSGVRAVLGTMRRLGIEINRETFIAFNWTEGEPEGAEGEAQLPIKLRNGYEPEDEDE